MTLGFGETIKAGFALFDRYERGPAFRAYVKAHGPELMAATAAIAIIAATITGAAIVFVGGTRRWAVLLAIVAAPALLVASLGLLLYIFFSWVETRVAPLAPPTHPATIWLHQKLGANLGGRPPAVPWPLVALFIGVPLFMTARLSWITALLMVLLAAAVPIGYARMEQASSTGV